MKKFFLVSGLLWLSACSEKQEKLPPGLMPPEKFISILADIHIAESQVEVMNVGSDSGKVVFEILQKELFKKKGVSKQIFDKTYTYYVNKNLIALDKIYESLVDTLSMREVNFNSKHGNIQPPPQKSDSSALK